MEKVEDSQNSNDQESINENSSALENISSSTNNDALPSMDINSNETSSDQNMSEGDS